MGNFFNDAFTDTLNASDPNSGAYYYIDSVNLFCIDEACATGIKNTSNFSASYIYTNPFTTSTTLTLTNYTPLNLQLFDALGREAPLQYHLTQRSNSTQLTIERGALRAGIYFLSITTQEKREVVRLVVF